MTLSIDDLTERDIAKTIDHSLLRPELDDAFVEDGCRLAAKYDVASVCVRPADVRRAKAILDGTDVAVGTTIGFPHGNHATEIKVAEARRALADGATELDMVLQIGALKSGRDADVEADIRAVVEVGHAAGAIVKVIFENAYLTDDEKVRACRLTEAAGARLRQDQHGLRALGRHARRPAADAGEHLAARPGQGRRRRPDAGRAPGRHGAGRHPDRGHGHRDDHPRLPGAQGGRARRSPPRAERGRLLMTTPVRVGMLGCGFIGEFHALGLRYVPTARLVANCDANQERREAYAARFGSRPLASIEELCADPEVDLVVVSVPNHLHREAVLALAAAGKAVACTKPLGRNAAEAADMLRAVTEAGVFNAYLENVIFNPDVLRMRDMVVAGSIGRLTTVRAREGHSGPHAPHFWDAELAGGGALLDMASHGAEYARFLFGKDVAVTEVFAWGATLVHGERTTGEDNAIMIMRFADGRAATIDVSWSSKGGLEGRFEAYGDAGRLITDISVGSLKAFVERPAGYLVEKADAETGWVFPVPDEVRVHGHDLMMADVIDAYRTGRAPSETFRDGYVVNGMLDAAYRSMRSGRWEPVTLDPALLGVTPTVAGA